MIRDFVAFISILFIEIQQQLYLNKTERFDPEVFISIIYNNNNYADEDLRVETFSFVQIQLLLSLSKLEY